MFKTIEWNPNVLELKPNDTVEEIIRNDAENTKYISDVVKKENILFGKINLITSSCGAGKSYFVLNRLPEMYPDVKPEEILVVTSRAITANQQATDKNATRIYASDPYSWSVDDAYDFESGEIKVPYIHGSKVGVTTYASFCRLLDVDHSYVPSKKILVFDEFHSVFVDTYTEYSRWLPFVISTMPDRQLVFAMTATPEPIYDFFCNDDILNMVLGKGEEIRKYRAKNMWCTFYDQIPSIVKNLDGKTLIMCNDSEKCEELSAAIPYSVVLYGRGHRKHTDNMGEILDYIAMSDTVPDGAWIPSGTKLADGAVIAKMFPFKVIISTTVLREGVNIRDYSGIRNVVCCSLNAVDIIQFAGRCRYDIDNLIIAPVRRRIYSVENERDSIYNSYVDFINTKKENAWSGSIVEALFSGCYSDVKIVNPSEPQKIMSINRANLTYKLTPFEHMMMNNFVNDASCPSEKWIKVGKAEYKYISEMARSTFYFHQNPSKFTVKKSMDYFCKKFDVRMVENNPRGEAKIRMYYMFDKDKITSPAMCRSINYVDEALFARYTNRYNTNDSDLRFIPPDEELDIRFRALMEMIFESYPVINYSVERICKRFCDLYGYHIKYVPRCIDGRQVECIALIENKEDGEK